jgi:hypothetical protein
MTGMTVETAENSSFATGAVDLPLSFFMGERTDVVEESISERWRDIVRGIRDEYLDATHRFPGLSVFQVGRTVR